MIEFLVSNFVESARPINSDLLCLRLWHCQPLPIHIPINRRLTINLRPGERVRRNARRDLTSASQSSNLLPRVILPAKDLSFVGMLDNPRHPFRISRYRQGLLIPKSGPSPQHRLELLRLVRTIDSIEGPFTPKSHRIRTRFDLHPLSILRILPINIVSVIDECWISLMIYG